ncbi:FHA domain-containing protein [Candidatus Villigracilis affinis]|nr:FHA domain-containing protein [Anaerolineales bacterium]
MIGQNEESNFTSSRDQNVFLIINRQMIPLEKKVTRLGRQLGNDVVLQEESVSRFHAEIRYEDGKYILYDNNSTAGTYVNSKRVDSCVLISSDLISFSCIQVMFVNNNARLAGKAMGMTQKLHAEK